MKKASIEFNEVVKILLAIILLLILVYIVKSLGGTGSDKLAFIKSIWRGTG